MLSSTVEMKESSMSVKKVGENYRCTVCGNEVTVTKVGGGTLVCCGKPMVLQA
jgi:desulfoferrodoxin-like iron-binding protein